MAMQSITISGLFSLLPVWFVTKLPVFIWGTMGSAKSSSIHKYVEDRRVEDPTFGFIDLRLSQLDPVDVRGLPSIDKEKKEASWIPFNSFPKEERDGKNGILLLEEFNSAIPQVQTTMYQLLFDRRIGDYILPDGWVVWALGNRACDGGHTYDMLAPVSNRFVGHYHLDPTVIDYTSHGLEVGVREEILGFLNWRPALLFSYNPDSSDLAFGSMRTWSYLSTLFNAWEATYEKIDYSNPPELFRVMVMNAVGEGEGIEFIAYLDGHGKRPNLDNIISDPDGSEIPEAMNICWAVISGLTNKYKSNRQIAGRLLRYACRMQAEFATVMVRQCTRVDSEFMENPEMVQFTRKFGDII